MSTSINTALIEIEKNLQDLSSAREQVLDVTESGRALASVVVELTQKMEALYEAVLKESGTYDNAFDKSRKDFEKNLKILLDQSQKDLSGFLEKLNNTETDLAQRIEKITESTSSKTEALYEKQEANFKQTVQQLKEYKDSVVKMTQDFNDFDFDSVIEPIETKIDKNEKTLVSVVKVFKSEAIQQMDQIVNTLKTKSEKLEEQVRTQQTEMIKTQKMEMENITNQLVEGLNQIELKQQNNAYITWGLIVVSLIILIFI